MAVDSGVAMDAGRDFSCVDMDAEREISSGAASRVGEDCLNDGLCRECALEGIDGVSTFTPCAGVFSMIEKRVLQRKQKNVP